MALEEVTWVEMEWRGTSMSKLTIQGMYSHTTMGKVNEVKQLPYSTKFEEHKFHVFANESSLQKLCTIKLFDLLLYTICCIDTGRTFPDVLIHNPYALSAGHSLCHFHMTPFFKVFKSGKRSS